MKTITYKNGLTLPVEQFIILEHQGLSPVGPFGSEQDAHDYYKRNQPTGLEYLAPPAIVRLMRPAPIGGYQAAEART